VNQRYYNNRYGNFSTGTTGFFMVVGKVSCLGETEELGEEVLLEV
jgi:hypothetical protein